MKLETARNLGDLKALKNLGEEVAYVDVDLSRFQLSMGYLLFKLRSIELRSIEMIEKSDEFAIEINKLREEVKNREKEIRLGKFVKLSKSCVALMLETDINPRLINYWISGAKSLEIISEICIPAIMRVLDDSGNKKEWITTLEYGADLISLANRFIDAFGHCIYAVMDELSKGKPIEEIDIETGNIDIYDQIILKACNKAITIPNKVLEQNEKTQK